MMIKRAIVSAAAVMVWVVALWAEPIRVLAIGNSFSRDAVEQHLHQLCQAEDIEIIIGNMYIGGCHLERHKKNMEEDSHDYQYRKIGLDGVRTNTHNFSLAEVLADEKWDYISLQESSGITGVYANYEANLPALCEYVREQCPDAQLIWHQTWAYSRDSGHREFPRYLNDQEQMYLDIMACSHRAVKQFGFDAIVPCGTAIQNARSSSAGDTLNKDGFHLLPGFGQFTAACTWFEQLFGRDVRTNAYSPESVDPHLCAIAKAAAHAAVLHPYWPTQIYM